MSRQQLRLYLLLNDASSMMYFNDELLIVGETGISKLGFCNKMGGIYYKLVGENDTKNFFFFNCVDCVFLCLISNQIYFQLIVIIHIITVKFLGNRDAYDEPNAQNY